MAEGESHLVLRIESPIHHVSGLSSLLRTLQAAVRDVGQRTDTGARMLQAQPAPMLVVDVESDGRGPLTLSFRFVAPDGATLHELNAAAFGVFMAELAAALKVTPQRSLWGTPVRPLRRSAAENDRLRLFLEDLARLGDVTVSAAGRRIVLSEGKVEAAQG